VINQAVADILETTLDGRGTGGGGDFSGGGGQGSGPSDSGAAPQRIYVTGMAIALGAILMFFISLVSAWIVRRGFAYGVAQTLDMPWRLLSLNTLILLASSFTLLLSRRRMRAHDDPGFRHWWCVTIILGVFFLAGQLLVWRQFVAEGLYLASNPDSSFFYVFTASHGLHLLGGIAALLAVAFRPVHRLTRETAVQVAAIYWHCMDALWLGLFLLFLTGFRA
jgi:cytochrome c oxidase subunit III